MAQQQFMVQTGTLLELGFHGPFPTDQSARKYSEDKLYEFAEVGIIPIAPPRGNGFLGRGQWVGQEGGLGPNGFLKFVGPFRSDDELEDYFSDTGTDCYSAIPLTPPDPDWLAGVTRPDTGVIKLEWTVGHRFWVMHANKPTECQIKEIVVGIMEDTLKFDYFAYTVDGVTRVQPEKIEEAFAITTKQALLDSLK
jgi:hypothetical protein